MKKVITLLVLILFISCNDSEKEQKIIGEWACTSWTSESGNDKCKNNVFFKFEPDKTYSSKIGGAKENGIYRVSNGLLYSTPEDKMEIAVEINILNSDSLQFTMSRSGNKEVLTLIRK